MKFYNLLSLIRADSFLRCTETVRDPVRNDEEPPGARVRRRLPPSPEGRAFSSGAFGCKIYGRHFCAHRYGCCAGVRLDRRISEPEIEKEEIHAVYNGYTKFISREFDTKEEAMHDREVCSTHCCICGKTARKRLRWFSAGGKNYYCVAWCPEHGYLKGKARMKHSDEGKLFVVKTIRISSEQEAGEIRQKKENLRKKRNQKRKEM